MSDLVILKRTSVVTLVKRPTTEVVVQQNGPPPPIVTQISVPNPIIIKRDGIPGLGLKGDKGDKGDRGDKGERGEAGSQTTLTWSPADVSNVWNIVHNLGRYPSVTVTDSLNRKVEADVSYLSQDIVRLDFVTPMTGYAHLN